MLVDPTVSFGSPIDGKPFVLVVPTDHEDAVVFLTPEALRNLVASGDAALVEHRQATCQHEWRPLLGVRESFCLRCDLHAVIEGDTVVPVGEGT